jgi:hypothetical protein
MKILILFVVLLFFLTPDMRAQDKSTNYPLNSPQSTSPIVCPWFTQGSAARAIGSDVFVTENVSNENEGSCKFLSRQDSMNSLEILVGKASVPTCPTDSARLTGIGNEATRCRLRESHGDLVEMVSSRVREIHFSITLSLHGQKSSKSSDPSNDTLQQIAEQVAGNLY